MKHTLKQIASSVSQNINEQNVHQMAKTIWLELQRNKKFNRLGELAELIRGEIAQKASLRMVEIISAQALSPEEKQLLISRIETKFAAKILPIYKVDPNILGGIKVKIEDELIDLSWKGKLSLISAKLEGHNE